MAEQSFMNRLFYGEKSGHLQRHPVGGGIFMRQVAPDEMRMRRDVGNLVSANVVMSPIQWVQRSFMEGTLRVEDQSGDEPEMVANHKMVDLIATPNKFYSGQHLWTGTLFSALTSGDAYWIIIRNQLGEPMELWYVPHWFMEPKWPQDGSEFLSHYEYRPGGQVIKIDPKDIVHFRIGLNPINPRKGMSPLGALLREVWTDMEAAAFVSAILKNGGVPGVIFSPADKDVKLDPTELEDAKAYLDSQFTGTRRGKALVTSGPTKVETFGFNPKEMDLSAIRNISEERVCAAIGIPAAVVGFGTGLQQTKVGATLTEMRKMAWFNGVIPLQKTFAGELNMSLLPAFGGKDNLAATFNNDDVKALQEDETAKETRILERVKAGVMTVEAAQIELGMVPDEGQDIYLRSISTIEVPSGEQEDEPEPAPSPIIELDEEGEPKSGTKSNGHHTLFEQRVAATAPRVKNPPEQLVRLAALLDREVVQFSKAFETRLSAFFVDLGRKAEKIALEVLSPKAGPEDAIIIERILEGMTMEDAIKSLNLKFTQHYLEVGKAAFDAVGEAFGLATGLPDPLGRRIAATGGTRSGLIDLTEQTRKSLFKAITEGREDGLAGKNLARRLRGGVEKGPWSSAKVRAEIIARTETKFAQNASTVLRAETMGAEKLMVFDARLGATDAICEALNGRIVTADEARQLAIDEHPNGTRSFTPVSPALLAEMELV